MNNWRIYIIWIILCIIFSGCATTNFNGVHYCLKEEPKISPPKNFLLMPIDITISELGVRGSSEEVPEWSQEGTKLITNCINGFIEEHKEIVMVKMPVLSEEERQTLGQHIALYHLVAGSALMLKNQPAWQHQRERPDGTIGNGLQFLKDKTGADTAIFITGQEFKSSGGRVLAFVAAAAMGVVTPMGHSMLHVGIVDLSTGNILWANTVVSDSFSLNSDEGSTTLVKTIFKKYPEFRKYIKQL